MFIGQEISSDEALVVSDAGLLVDQMMVCHFQSPDDFFPLYLGKEGICVDIS